MTDSEFENQLLYIGEMLMRSAKRLTSNHKDVENLVQESILNLLDYQKHFGGDIVDLKTWAYAIMKNTFLNHYPKNTDQATPGVAEEPCFPSIEESIFSEDPDAAFLETEINKVSDHIKNKLQTPIRRYKYLKIANALGMRISNVKRRFFYSRKKLNRIYPDAIRFQK